MLNIFVGDRLPDKLKIISVNDRYFRVNTLIKEDDVVSKILYDIDNVIRVGSDKVYSRFSPDVAISKNYLSTGTKTLLNIIAHPDKCFDVCECGNNALLALGLIKEGNIYWHAPAMFLDDCEDVQCSFSVYGKEFHSFCAFLDYMRYDFY